VVHPRYIICHDSEKISVCVCVGGGGDCISCDALSWTELCVVVWCGVWFDLGCLNREGLKIVIMHIIVTVTNFEVIVFLKM
jgi:hypothetical protein